MGEAGSYLCMKRGGGTGVTGAERASLNLVAKRRRTLFFGMCFPANISYDFQCGFLFFSSRVFYTVSWSGSVVCFLWCCFCGLVFSFTGIPLICIYSALNS